MNNKDMLVSIDDDSLNTVSGGHGICIDPCKLVSDAAALGVDVINKGAALVEGALSCLPSVSVSLSVSAGAGCSTASVG
ncbi:MAG: hypothetical protein JWN04_2766 [Myxococcaceae bacterium]|nr:hypothetical protein [Myxococcaceae bacterium]